MMLKHRILQVYWPRILNHRKLVMAACLYTLKILFNDFLSLNSCSIFKFLFDNTYTTTIICLPVWLTRLILARKGTLPLHVCISSIIHTGLFFIIYLFFRLFFKLLTEKSFMYVIEYVFWYFLKGTLRDAMRSQRLPSQHLPAYLHLCPYSLSFLLLLWIFCLCSYPRPALHL